VSTVTGHEAASPPSVATDRGDLSALVVQQRLEGVDHLEVRRRRDVVVPLQLAEEPVAQSQRRRMELLAHLDAAATYRVVHLDVAEETRRHRLRAIGDEKLSYRAGTARCVVSVEILPTATQQCRNYFTYDKF